MIYKTSFTIEEVKRKLEKYCSYQDRCHQEIDKKLNEMKMIVEVREQVILHLIAHDFLNEERYAKSFARGKFRIKKWGKQRIIRELKSKSITISNINIALSEIVEVEYYRTFDELAQKRLNAISETNIYKKRKKLADYLLYRGWESDLVYQKTLQLISK